MRVLISPDSFKGTLSAKAAAEAIAAGIRQACPEAQCDCLPMADGGEGTLAALESLPGVHWHTDVVRGMEGEPVGAAWLSLADGTAVIESAEVVGLGLVGQSPLMQRHTMGLGQLLRAALASGAPRVIVGLGGTGTNDGGAGLLVALGARLLDRAGKLLSPAPATLHRLYRLDLTGLDSRLARIRLLALADVSNPLSGPQGATAVYGPQKGLIAEDAAALDRSVAYLGTLGDASAGRALRTMPGSGAAGGLGWALRLLGAEIQPGAEVLADLLGLDALLTGADYLITGEGRSDAQTLQGKLPWRLAQHAAACGVPAVLLSGDIDTAARGELAHRFTHLHALTDRYPSEKAQSNAANCLQDCAREWAMTISGLQ
ncbi:glycerate kinase [Chitinimonas sp. BJYL2]|uniref:glycerate kinase n=1 Tax=Chitinimonas sp. BJYL2 TaxID=2976696 RepID=UPI0022B3A778|nr:glycerate kinase [Chitinimonas sp. BJYL2]